MTNKKDEVYRAISIIAMIVLTIFAPSDFGPIRHAMYVACIITVPFVLNYIYCGLNLE